MQNVGLDMWAPGMDRKSQREDSKGMYQTDSVVYVGKGMCKEQGDTMAVQAWDTRCHVHVYSIK